MGPLEIVGMIGKLGVLAAKLIEDEGREATPEEMDAAMGEFEGALEDLEAKIARKKAEKAGGG